MSFEVIKPGLMTTFQDGGRFGVQDQGIPVSGFMDESSAQIANSILGNAPNAPVLEMCQIGCTIKALTEFSVAFFGAHMGINLNKYAVPQGKVIVLTTGDILEIGFSKQGVYGYLAFSGIPQLEKVYESYSTYLPAQFGGFYGRTLQKGDIIRLSRHEVLKNSFSVIKPQKFNKEASLQVYQGPEWNILPDSSKQKLINTSFTVSKDINRIGYRLEGDEIELGQQKEIISSGMVKGTVQITSSGTPIIMMSDAPTSGGYIRALNLSARACDQLAQMPVGSIIKFQL
ncbi:biotin-dependent carboxyltransferase family protein [Flammeovirga sp. SubArs3]|uniref:5-oxoprolinase subunit C family protein n=1 Tax=Flammeovirga sp. SubArs3 TaxID=2995316 RepID=UPI00248ADCC5|nr:biotin-dependent carboxyltransferase family protein [Flammeovirga sp. SubArs3]